MSEKNLLEIKDLHVNVEDKEILHGVNLEVGKDEVHVLMGPNGTGKSDRKSTRLNSSHSRKSRMPSSA